MRIIRNGMIFLFTIIVIILCAMLPQITADISDSLSDEKVEYGDIKTVTFKQDLTTIEKLFLLRDNLQVHVSEDNTNKTFEQIAEIARGELHNYADMGLLYIAPEDFEVNAEPALYFNNDFNNLTWTFWRVDFVYNENEETLQLWIDDETGETLLITYSTPYQIYDEAFYEEYLNILFCYYMERLQLSEDNPESPEENHATDMYIEVEPEPETEKYYKSKKNMLECSWYMKDALYGELNVRFIVHSNGFTVCLE